MATEIWVNIGLGNVTWSHQAIIWTNVDLSSARSSDIYLKALSLEIPQVSVTKISLNVSHLKFNSKLPGPMSQ